MNVLNSTLQELSTLKPSCQVYNLYENSSSVPSSVDGITTYDIGTDPDGADFSTVRLRGIAFRAPTVRQGNTKLFLWFSCFNYLIIDILVREKIT